MPLNYSCAGYTLGGYFRLIRAAAVRHSAVAAPSHVQRLLDTRIGVQTRSDRFRTRSAAARHALAASSTHVQRLPDAPRWLSNTCSCFHTRSAQRRADTLRDLPPPPLPPRPALALRLAAPPEELLLLDEREREDADALRPPRARGGEKRRRGEGERDLLRGGGDLDRRGPPRLTGLRLRLGLLRPPRLRLRLRLNRPLPPAQRPPGLGFRDEGLGNRV